MEDLDRQQDQETLGKASDFPVRDTEAKGASTGKPAEAMIERLDESSRGGDATKMVDNNLSDHARSQHHEFLEAEPDVYSDEDLANRP